MLKSITRFESTATVKMITNRMLNCFWKSTQIESENQCDRIIKSFLIECKSRYELNVKFDSNQMKKSVWIESVQLECKNQCNSNRIVKSIPVERKNQSM